MRTGHRILFVGLLLVMAFVLPASRSSAANGGGDQPPFGDSNGTTCANKCDDGSWSSIACLDNEMAVCSCTGSPLQANPYCF